MNTSKNSTEQNRTIEYYNEKAKAFADDTLTVEFTETQERFCGLLAEGAKVLDFGCGSGRDTKYFLGKGLDVDAIDGSRELCKIASKNTGIKVREMLFSELDEIEKYDGIWACSSILHLNKSELCDVLEKISIALKQNGVLYTSFKFGDFEGERNGRYFTDFTIEKFELLIKKVPALKIEQSWVTCDVRPGRGDEKWLNLILRKS